MSTRYVVVFNDLQKPGYMNFGVLPDTRGSLQEAEIMMAHRAEELMDELATVDIDNDRDPGNYEMRYDDDKLSVAIVDIDGGNFHMRVIHTILTIQPIVV